jgi:hypothetical protein
LRLGDVAAHRVELDRAVKSLELGFGDRASHRLRIQALPARRPRRRPARPPPTRPPDRAARSDESARSLARNPRPCQTARPYNRSSVVDLANGELVAVLGVGAVDGVFDGQRDGGAETPPTLHRSAAARLGPRIPHAQAYAVQRAWFNPTLATCGARGSSKKGLLTAQQLRRAPLKARRR